MTNEELAVLIQDGERDKPVELWAQVRRMALKEAVRWAAYRSNGVELDDLEQAGFIALMRAVDGFDPAAGTRFSTWYHRILLTEFEAATGRRTEKQRRDPLDAAVSLDAPITEDSDNISLGDTVPDPVAEAAMADVDRREDLRAFMRRWRRLYQRFRMSCKPPSGAGTIAGRSLTQMPIVRPCVCCGAQNAPRR